MDAANNDDNIDNDFTFSFNNDQEHFDRCK